MSRLKWTRYVEKVESRLLALPGGVLQAVERLEDLSMEAILACAGATALTAHDLRLLARCRRAWQRWQTEADARAPKGFVGDAGWEDVWSLDRLDVLERVGRLFSTVGGSASPEAWRAGVKIWAGAAGIARKEARWHCQPVNTSHPRFSHYGEVFGRKETLEELPGHRWLAGAQGEAEGVLKVCWDLPEAAMVQQVALYRSDLGDVVEGRSDASLLEELVLHDLPYWLQRWAREQATLQAIESATTSYRELLLQAPLRVDKLAAVYIGGEASRPAIAWLDAQGKVLTHRRVGTVERGGHGRESEVATFARALREALPAGSCDAVVLPLRAVSRTLLQEAVKALSTDFALHRVREAGLSEARETWLGPPYNYPKEVAAAVALGHRVLFPKRAWSQLDPIALGLAEYQDLLDATALREALLDERALIEAGLVKPDALGLSLAAQGSQEQKRLNPMVKSLEDLKSGMTLQGIVANVTDFGAFVNLGLPEEGLVHKSELADRFVSHPSEVVRVGQQVQVRVLSTELAARRISLSMRTSLAPKPKTSTQRKAQALRDLDKLFKK